MVREAAIAALREHMSIGPLASGQAKGRVPTQLGGVRLEASLQSTACPEGASQSTVQPERAVQSMPPPERETQSAVQSERTSEAKLQLVKTGLADSLASVSGTGRPAAVIVVEMRHFMAAISKIKPSVSEKVSLVVRLQMHFVLSELVSG